MLYPNDYSLGNLTLHYWIGKGQQALAEGESGILRNAQILGAAWNSVKLSVWVAFLVGMFGIFIGYAVVKGRGTMLSSALEQQSFLSLFDSQHRVRGALPFPLHPKDRAHPVPLRNLSSPGPGLHGQKSSFLRKVGDFLHASSGW
jgi:hypothetical protein